MKFVIINDTHAGVSNSSDVHLDNAERFYSDVLFPYLLEHDIKQIVHLGDYYDNRRVINAKCMARNEKMFLDKLVEHDIFMDIILGNHDVYYKTTNEVSATVSILKRHSHVKVIEHPLVRYYDGCKIALLPWINSQNYDKSLEFIKTAYTQAPILFGHLELGGFAMMKNGFVSSEDHGMSAKLFDKYELVLSGHFHTKSRRDNIYYLGSQLEFTWADCDDDKYFYVFDTDTHEVTPVRNPHTLYKKVYYDDSGCSNIDEVCAKCGVSREELENKFVKLIVERKSDIKLYDAFVTRISDYRTHDLQIVDILDYCKSENVDDDRIDIVDTMTLLSTYVESIETDLSKDIIHRRLTDLYNEAQNI